MGKDVRNVLQPYYKYFMNESEKLRMKKPTNSAGSPMSADTSFEVVCLV